MANARKLLARLEPRSLPIGESKPPRANIGTAPDARMHAPPRTPEWRRIEMALARLREGVRGQAGSARVHAPAPTRTTRDPDATENIDIAGALAFAVQRPDGADTSPVARRQRQLAINVYLFRNWPAFEDQHRTAMQSWSRAAVERVAEKARQAGQEWARRAKANKGCTETLARIADAAVDEFARPEHCSACDGHGTEQTGVRVGLSCTKCGGACEVDRSANVRAGACRVRRGDWSDVWEPPYLALLDHMRELEREGAALHAHALGY